MQLAVNFYADAEKSNFSVTHSDVVWSGFRQVSFWQRKVSVAWVLSSKTTRGIPTLELRFVKAFSYFCRGGGGIWFDSWEAKVARIASMP